MTWAEGIPWVGAMEAIAHVEGVHRALVVRIESLTDLPLMFSIRDLWPDAPAAWCHPEYPREIALLRPRRSDEPGDLLLETVQLAHELGHLMSWERGEPAEAYKAARDVVNRAEGVAMRALTPAESKAVLDEEARASRYGREVLQELGLRDLTAADDHTARNLAVYETRLADVG